MEPISNELATAPTRNRTRRGWANPKCLPGGGSLAVPSPLLVSGWNNQELWNRYFPDVPLTDARWIERCDARYLEKALRITATKDKSQRFAVRDQNNIGRYVSRVVTRLRNGESFSADGKIATITFPITLAAGYRFTDKDKERFTAFLRPDGDCQRWKGTKTRDGYGRFKVNGETSYAHHVAFFMEKGYLPVDGELDGKPFNVAHNCRHPDCCNPKHLRITSKRVNLDEREYLRAEGLSVTGRKREYSTTQPTTFVNEPTPTSPSTSTS